MEHLKRSSFLILALALCALHAPSLVIAVKPPPAPPTSPSTTPTPTDKGSFLSHLSCCFRPVGPSLATVESFKQNPTDEETAKQVIDALLNHKLKRSSWRKRYKLFHFSTGMGEQAIYDIYRILQEFLPLCETNPSPPNPIEQEVLGKLKEHLGYSYVDGVFSIELHAYTVPFEITWEETIKIRLQRPMDLPETLLEILNAVNLLLAESFMFNTDGAEEQFDLDVVESYFARFLNIVYQSKSAYNPYKINKWHTLFRYRLNAMGWKDNSKEAAWGEKMQEKILNVRHMVTNELPNSELATDSDNNPRWVFPNDPVKQHEQAGETEQTWI